ncbi:alpha/beta fold hydrolase [Undibacterium sp. Xuan67W]|uniref:alpha/beta fold hydrolase n=1 Tax=Undibacterium sp. Xuan67W TaxID=3413057 RepID=UPI003BF074FC
MLSIVLLPGMDGSGTLFTDFVTALGPEFNPIVVAYPPDLPLNYAALEEIARAHLPLGKPFILLGESFSGPIAISLAASNPEGLIALILSCTFAKNPHTYFHPISSLIRLLPVKGQLLNLIWPLLLGKYANTRLRSLLRHALLLVSANALRIRLKSVLEVDYSAELKKVSVPVLYLRATDDYVVFSNASRHIAQLLPALTQIDVKGPHLLLQAVPGITANAIKNFVEKIHCTTTSAISQEHTATKRD